MGHAPRSPQRRAGCSAGCRRRACTCPHRDPCSLGQTTAALPTPAELGVCSEKETVNVILSSRVDFLEAYDVHSVNLNYSEISDSLYRFVPLAEFTVFPLKKKNSFCPGLKGTGGWCYCGIRWVKAMEATRYLAMYRTALHHKELCNAKVKKP